MLSKEMGCDSSGSTCWRRLRDDREKAGVWRKLHRVLLDRLLGEADRIDRSRASLDSASVGAKRGAKRPARTRRIGENRALQAPRCGGPRSGVPLTVVLTAANVYDSTTFEESLDAIGPTKRPRGRPRKRPEKLHADKAYDDAKKKCRKALRGRGIESRIARRKGKGIGERLGRRHRWVVERTLAWLARYRKLAVRYERWADIHEAFLHVPPSRMLPHLPQLPIVVRVLQGALSVG